MPGQRTKPPVLLALLAGAQPEDVEQRQSRHGEAARGGDSDETQMARPPAHREHP